jgi:aminoglycoside phosphotransferase (APT) family kinase protein
VSDIDASAIVRELGFEGSYSVSLLAENRGKGVWRVQGDEGTFALRVLRPGEHATAMAEARAMEAASGTGAPAPRVVATTSFEGRPVMLLSWCDGRPLRDAGRARPWEAYALGVTCGRAQAQLNTQPPPADFGVVPWITRFGEVDDELRSRLTAVEQSPGGLLHLDFHSDNVLVDGREVTGLVDWTNACAGDGRADLARSWSLLTHRARGGARGRATALVWRMVAAGWQRGYEQVAGPQRDMALFRIWALTGLLNTLRADGAAAGDLTRLETRIARMRNRGGLSTAG